MDFDADALATVAVENNFTGSIRVDAGDETLFEASFGLADRPHELANTPQTWFGVASISRC